MDEGGAGAGAKRVRCIWPTRPLELAYHDNEWGVPCHDDRLLFEYLLLDSMQAGLNWYTMLIKRENFRKAFAAFDAEAVARFDEQDIARLMQDAGIIRNLRKIQAVIGNAKGFLSIQEEHGSFDAYLWGFVDGHTIRNSFGPKDPSPTTSPESDALSKDLRQRGFRFVGSITLYAFMEGSGLYNNHIVECFRYHEV